MWPRCSFSTLVRPCWRCSTLFFLTCPRSSHAEIPVPLLSSTRALRVGIVILFFLQGVCGTPAAPLQPVNVSSPCSLTDGGSCAASPNYPNSYGNSEECTISGVPTVELETVAFDVEGDAWSYYDYDRNGDPMDDCPSDYLTDRGPTAS